MTENFIKLPDDSANAGKLVRTNERIVNGSSVEEHFTIMQDYASDNQAKIDSDGKLNVAGSISSIPSVSINNVSTIGSYTYQNVIPSGATTIQGTVYNTEIGPNIQENLYWDLEGANKDVPSTILVDALTGSYASVTDDHELLVTGSVHVQNTYLGSKSYQGTTPWVILGSVHQTNSTTTGSEQWIKNTVEVSGNVFKDITGSVYVSNQISVNSGSESWIKNFGVLGSDRTVSNRVAGSIVNMPSITISNPSTIGSYSTQNILGSVAITSPISVTAGSESYIKGGSVEVYTGSIYVTNFSAGTGYAGSDTYVKAGSVVITNTVPGSIISMPAVSVTAGSNVWVQNVVTGSIISMPDINVTTGSEVYIQNSYLGSKAYQGTNPWIVLGSVYQTNATSVTTGSEQWIKNWGELGSVVVVDNFGDLGSNITGSVYITNSSDVGGYAGSEVWEQNLYAGSKFYQGDRFGISGAVDINNRVAGSIVNWPGSIAVSNFNSIGSNRVITNFGVLGSARTISNRVAGSIVNMPNVIGVSGTYFQDIAGSVAITSPISVSTGSNMWIKGGSVSTYGTNAVSGTAFHDVLGSVAITSPISVTAGSESYIKAGSVEIYNLGSNAWVEVTTGSIHVTNFSAGTGYAGSDVWQGTDPWIVEGSVAISSPISVDVGSESWIQNVVEVSGSKLDDLTGSFYLTNPDEINISAGSEQWIKNFGDLGSNAVITNFGTLGSSRIITAGSVITINQQTINDIGSPSFKRGILTASGTYADVWPIGAAGSRVEIHGFHISTDNAGYVRIVNSGTTPEVVTDYNLNYASGATIEKTFSSPIIPGGADIPIGFGTTVAGSTLVTVYGREVV